MSPPIGVTIFCTPIREISPLWFAGCPLLGHNCLGVRAIKDMPPLHLDCHC